MRWNRLLTLLCLCDFVLGCGKARDGASAEATALIGSDVDATAVATELTALAGTWTYERHIVNGREYTAAEMADDCITIRGNSVVRGKLSQVGQPPDPHDLVTIVSTIRIDPTVTPKRLDDHQSHLVRPALGIYKLDGDRLTLCWGNATPKRPTTFDSIEGSPFVLSVLRKRVK